MKPSVTVKSVKGSEGGPGSLPRPSDPLYLQHLFAINVKLIRVSRAISQEELADRAALDRTYISSIERRLRNLSIQNVQRIAAALEVDPRALLDPLLYRVIKKPLGLPSTRL